MKRRKSILAIILLCALLVSGCTASKHFYTDPHTRSSLMPTSSIPSNSYFEVHYIDVGQADAALVLCDGESMLIDGGNASDSNLIAAYLKKLNIETLDYIICSHAHEDHVGGLSGALSVVKVKNVLAPQKEVDTKAYKNFKEKTAAQGLTIVHPKAGDKFTLGSCEIEIFGPINENPKETNNSSIVMKLTYGDTSFLFTGDAERAEETDILNARYDLSADVLKIGHHGSDTSTSYVFLREIMPKYAVISVGKNNNGHPSEAVLSRLKDADAIVYRTDLQGDIIAASDGSNITITTSEN